MTILTTWRPLALVAMRLLFCTSLIIALLNKGANNDIVVALECAIVFALLPLAIATIGIPQHTQRALAIALFQMTCIFVWAVVQNTPLPGLGNDAWGNLSPWFADLPAITSVSPGEDFNAFLKIALPIGAFMLTLVLFPSDHEADLVIRTLTTCGAIIAVASIIQFGVFPKILIMDVKSSYLDSLTGPFVNRNTAATFFGLMALLTLPLLMHALGRIHFVRISIATLSNRRLCLEERRTLARLALAVAMVFASLLALSLTQSRAGIASTVAGLIAFLLLHGLGMGKNHNHETRRSNPARIFGLMAFGMVIVVALGLLTDRVLYRSSISGSDDARFCVWPGVFDAARDNLPWGTGLGSFSTVFPRYRPIDCGITYFWDKAHNFYLEGLLTIGVLFPIVFTIGISGLLSFFITGRRNRKKFRIAGDVGIALMILVILHAAWDFSLQIPGFSMVLSVALAALTTLCLRPSRSITLEESANRTVSTSTR